VAGGGWSAGNGFGGGSFLKGKGRGRGTLRGEEKLEPLAQAARPAAAESFSVKRMLIQERFFDKFWDRAAVSAFRIRRGLRSGL